MEYCPYCQRWVEPTKGNTDLLAGHAFGLIGTLVGAGHYLIKGSRCPICNNVIRGLGAPVYAYPQHALPGQGYVLSGPYSPAPVASAAKRCIRCGVAIKGTSVFCPHCGARQL